MDVRAPQSGRVLALADVPDPVFAAAMVGPGVAISPGATGAVRAGAPVAGELMLAKPHAFLVRGDAGTVLVHLGIDTIDLRGEGFEVLAAVGDLLAAGDPVVGWDPVAVAAHGLSPLVVVIAMGAAAADVGAEVAAGEEVGAGDLLFRWPAGA